jgi:hypothetical protein
MRDWTDWKMTDERLTEIQQMLVRAQSSGRYGMGEWYEAVGELVEALLMTREQLTEIQKELGECLKAEMMRRTRSMEARGEK